MAGAKAQFAPSRVNWERIEPIAGLVSEIDGAVDSRVDDFASPEDPKWTGWHRLEYLLWEKDTTAGGGRGGDQAGHRPGHPGDQGQGAGADAEGGSRWAPAS